MSQPKRAMLSLLFCPHYCNKIFCSSSVNYALFSTSHRSRSRSRSLLARSKSTAESIYRSRLSRSSSTGRFWKHSDLCNTIKHSTMLAMRLPSIEIQQDFSTCIKQICSDFKQKRCSFYSGNYSQTPWRGSVLKQRRTQSTRSQDTVMNVFDRKAKRLQRDRAALSYVGENVSVYDYLKDEFGYRLADRICDIKRVFKTAVDLGCGRGHLSKNIYSDMVENLYQCEFSKEMLMHAVPSPEVPTHRLIVDEEFLPFKDNSLDIVVSNLSLHWVNDLPRCLKQILQALKNDGVLISSMFGGDTLYELRVSLQLAEQEREGGFAPHISPYTTVNDLGNLLTRAGYTMLTIDIDDMTINYPSIFELMYDLKGMAENNCSWSRKPQLHRDTLIAAASIYKEMYGNDQGVPATFEVINFIGWKPDSSQPKAAKRGSASVSIKDIGRLDELTKQMEEMQKSKEPSETAKEKLQEDMQKFAKKLKDPDNSGRKQ